MADLFHHDIPPGGSAYGIKPRIYRAGRLVAEVGNAELDQDRWDDDCRLMVDGANLLLKQTSVDAKDSNDG